MRGIVASGAPDGEEGIEGGARETLAVHALEVAAHHVELAEHGVGLQHAYRYWRSDSHTARIDAEIIAVEGIREGFVLNLPHRMEISLRRTGIYHYQVATASILVGRPGGLLALHNALILAVIAHGEPYICRRWHLIVAKKDRQRIIMDQCGQLDSR